MELVPVAGSAAMLLAGVALRRAGFVTGQDGLSLLRLVRLPVPNAASPAPPSNASIYLFIYLFIYHPCLLSRYFFSTRETRLRFSRNSTM